MARRMELARPAAHHRHCHRCPPDTLSSACTCGMAPAWMACAYACLPQPMRLLVMQRSAAPTASCRSRRGAHTAGGRGPSGSPAARRQAHWLTHSPGHHNLFADHQKGSPGRYPSIHPIAMSTMMLPPSVPASMLSYHGTVRLSRQQRAQPSPHQVPPCSALPCSAAQYSSTAAVQAAGPSAVLCCLTRISKG